METVYRNFGDILLLRNLFCQPFFFAEAKPVWVLFSLKSYGDRTKFVATVRESLYTME